MKIAIGSKNPAKVDALREILFGYELFHGAEVTPLEVSSGVPEQPKSLEETVRGAMNRAKEAFQDCSYSFGIEGGFMPVPYTKSGYLEFQACAIYDGKNFHIGFSSAYECPREAVRLIFTEGIDLSQAAMKIGLTSHPKIGMADGIISILTKGRLIRKEFTKEAIRMALIHLENPDLY